MRGTKLTVSIKAVAFAIKGNLTEDIKLERLRLFLDQEATRKGIRLDTDEPMLQGLVDSKDEFYFYNGPKGRPLALPEIPDQG
ncbi:hypothetical protein [Armatimonas sp.]|uniref:hypothetical protein n=1 Tax=Armatimonas sp. TaxID=1872638 RepID=UPI00286B5F8C|nr:hypothetical protein [Armatimonas sp.]